jgi:hypothetical protein
MELILVSIRYRGPARNLNFLGVDFEERGELAQVERVALQRALVVIQTLFVYHTAFPINHLKIHILHS